MKKICLSQQKEDIIYFNLKEDIVLEECEYKKRLLKKAQKLWNEIGEFHREIYGRFENFLKWIESHDEKDWDYTYIETERYKEADDLAFLWCLALHIDEEIDENWEDMINNKQIIARITSSWYLSLGFEVIDIKDGYRFSKIKFTKAEIKNKKDMINMKDKTIDELKKYAYEVLDSDSFEDFIANDNVRAYQFEGSEYRYHDKCPVSRWSVVLEDGDCICLYKDIPCW